MCGFAIAQAAKGGCQGDPRPLCASGDRGERATVLVLSPPLLAYRAVPREAQRGAGQGR